MKLVGLSLFVLATSVSAVSSLAQATSADFVFEKATSVEATLVQRQHQKANLFEVDILDVIPSTLGTDCAASVDVSSRFSIGSPTKYVEASAEFSACNGAPNSKLKLSELTFKAVPCKPHYAEEQENKSCGGPLDEPEPDRLHLPLQTSGIILTSAFHSLLEAGVDLSLPYDVKITTAARLTSTSEPFDLAKTPGQLDRLNSIAPGTPVILFRGRQTKGNDQATMALVEAANGTILFLDRNSPLRLAPPSRP